jgi:hypothetical protein
MRLKSYAFGRFLQPAMNGHILYKKDKMYNL